MRHHSYQRALHLATILLVGIILLPQPAAAQTKALPGGVTVAPAFVSADINPGSSQTYATVGVRNDFNVPVSFTTSLSRMHLENNSLTPTNTDDPFIDSIVMVSPATFDLAPHKAVNLQLAINDSVHLTPGGHYVALIIKQTSNNGQQISIEPAVSVTLFITKHAGAIGDIKVTKITAAHSLFSMPKSVDVTFINKGNVYVVPRGLIVLKKDSRIYQQAPINSDSTPLFQDNSLTLRTQLLHLTSPHFPGRYTVQVAYRYDGQAKYMLATNTFWYIPKMYVIGLLGIGAIVYYLSDSKRRTKAFARVPSRTRKASFDIKPAAPKPVDPNRRSIAVAILDDANDSSTGDAPESAIATVVTADPAANDVQSPSEPVEQAPSSTVLISPTISEPIDAPPADKAIEVKTSKVKSSTVKASSKSAAKVPKKVVKSTKKVAKKPTKSTRKKSTPKSAEK